jgi:hypothetical protein
MGQHEKKSLIFETAYIVESNIIKAQTSNSCLTVFEIYNLSTNMQ